MTGLTGTRTLIRLALRVDRLRLPLWVLAISTVVVTTAVSFAGLYPDEATREQLAVGIGANPALQALYGPLYAPESIGGLTVWRQGMIAMVLVSLMSLLAVVRHTRGAEETGRLELIGAAVVGRRAPLAAGLATAGLADAAVMVLVTVGLVGIGESWVGSVGFALAIGTTGLVFAAIAALTAQLTDNARTASGMAGAALAAAFVLRAAGDTAGDQGAAWLSWMSPLGWAQRVRPYADERWWPLVLVGALAAVLVVAAYVLVSRRDFGSGLWPARRGPERASPALASPFGLAWRLQRATLGWWAVGMLVIGGVFGAVVEAITDLVEQTPQLAEVFERLGGAGRLVDAFLAAILGVVAILASVHALTAAGRLRAEEAAWRAEPVLSTGTTRLRWAASHLVVAVVGPGLLLALAGGAAGLTSGLVLGQGTGQVGRLSLAALAHLPAVWVLVGIATFCLGVFPRWTSAAYGALGAFLLLGQVGAALQFDQAWLNLSPFAHVPDVPSARLAWTPLVWLTAVAVALTTVGLGALRRRDIG